MACCKKKILLLWPVFENLSFLLMMVLGGPAGSTSVQFMVSLVVDNIAMVADEVVDSEASQKHAKEVKRQRP